MIPRSPSTILRAMLLALSLGAAPAAADAPVVVELYTSQGCSACPPADALLRELAGRDDVIALGLHVDYWDYIGWADAFADPAHAKRQKAYARQAGDRMIYTPQMVVGGTDRVVGHDGREVRRAIDAHLGAPAAARLALRREGGRLRVRGEAARWPGGSADVVLATYAPGRTVSILSGENAGHMLDYVNVVTGMRRIGTWDGREPLDLTVDVPEGEPAAVIVQRPGPGLVLAAAKAD